MGIREWVLRPYYWWKARRKKRLQHKQNAEEGIIVNVWPDLETDKTMKIAAIAAKNRERQQNTLGYGLKSRNFRPRPGYEKRLYDLTKKPGEDD